MQETLAHLRRQLAALETAPARPGGAFALGPAELDAVLGGGLAAGALHEVVPAAPGDAGTAAGFSAALALRAAVKAFPGEVDTGSPSGNAAPKAFPGEVGTGSPSRNAVQRRSGTRFLAWVRQAFAETETGRLHAPGLAAFGLDPARLILVRARDTVGVLRAGVEAARCSGLGAVIIEPWGNHRALDLTATRRLALAAEKSGIAVILLRQGGEAKASAASTRWRVGAFASGPLAANAPGRPAFDVTLLRHRAGPAGSAWRLEWDHEQHVFRRLAPLSGAVVSLPSDRPAAAQILPLARAG